MILYLRVLIGLGVLSLGRQLFWLFVGGIGFMAGIELANRVVVSQSDAATLLIALATGMIGALLALLMQRLAIGAAGFFGGSLILMNLVRSLPLEVSSDLLPFLLGGIIGALCTMFLFDWALIFLSVAAGAAFVVQSLSLERPQAYITFGLLALFGAALQSRQLMRQRAKSSR